MGMITATIMPIPSTITTMTDGLALQRLLIWASPAFPVGTFAYSGGLETAIAEGAVRDAEAMRDWLEGNLQSGAGRNDAILAALACRAHDDAARLSDLADLCLALTPARQRHEELLVTGHAFIQAAKAWSDPVHERLPAACPYPIAFGAIAGAASINAVNAALAFLTAYAQAQVSVAVRLIPIGQTSGLAILAALEPLIADLAKTLADADENDLGAIAYATDIAAMNHETLTTRIFRS
ncbi:urease accessory protein UreF [Tianweitania populi]|nr:urease accessory UreF family protein [Tianweitania populi]